MRMVILLSLIIEVLSVLYFQPISLLCKNMLFSIKEAAYYFAKNEDLLLIGITSSQDHFKQRQSLRDTWLTLVLKPKIMYYFLIGKDVCPIPPLDRESYLVCEEKIYNLPNNLTDYTQFSTVGEDLEEVPNYKGHGFHFIVNHGIVIHYLGIQRDVLVNVSSVRVSLYDSFRQERIVSATFIANEEQNEDYIWKKIPPVYLPGDTEAEVRLEGTADLCLHCKCKQGWSNGGGVMRYLNIVSSNTRVKFNSNLCFLSAFNFTIKDSDKLTAHIGTKAERLDSWLDHKKHLEDELEEEVNVKKDILLLDMVDVYRNLPLKVLLFYRWAGETQRFKYLLKTDDDTFVNILSVESELKLNLEWDWWSCFRKNWPVQRAGKWKETTFKDSVYPTFPSGAGYVLTWNVILSMYQNINNLSTSYQGEDVAVGIWVRELKLTEHVGGQCVWACDERCFSRSCNVGQLRVQDMYLMMESYNVSNRSIDKCPNDNR